MNKVPGFTAEASLYRTAGQYQSAGIPGRDGGTIHPAQITIPPIPVPGCNRDCLSRCELGCRIRCCRWGWP